MELAEPGGAAERRKSRLGMTLVFASDKE